MRWSVVAAASAAIVSTAACSDAVVLEIASDRPIPSALDAICVGVADSELRARPFGRHYRLERELARLPQTLRLEPGSAERAWAWVRADRAGVPTARAIVSVDFTDDPTLRLDACVRGPARDAEVVARTDVVRGGRVVASHGAGGVLAVALGDATSIVDARGDDIVTADAPALRGPFVDAIAADLDGDCDDDLVVTTATKRIALWRRDGVSFTDAGDLEAGSISAVAAADVDRDGAIDLVLAGEGVLELWRNDGAANFTVDHAALSSGGRVTSPRALALGDLDGDGNPDLVVGQGGNPLVAWLGEPSGTGTFLPADAVIPPVPLDVHRLALADVDGDDDPDLAVAVRSGPARLYITRDGRLEDQSFVRLPQPAPIASAFAIGGWDAGCETDAVIAGMAGSTALRGTPTLAFDADAALPAASDAVLIDLDEDGDLDTVLATAEGVTWLRR